jgi:hypothetical protein
MLTPLWPAGLAALLLYHHPHPAGYVFPKSPRHARVVVRPAVPYEPREGDLIFYDDRNPTWTALFALAGTGPPLHMGIVVKKPDGSMSVLEAGPDDTLWVRMLDLAPRLRQFHRDFRGTIAIRRCKVALGRRQSAALTKFALAQEGKRYAALRLLAQGTPLRARGPLGPLLARTRLDRDSWICSELAVAAGTVAGLFDPQDVQANATYPRDLVDNRRHDLRRVWEDAVVWRPGRIKPSRQPHHRPRSASERPVAGRSRLQQRVGAQRQPGAEEGCQDDRQPPLAPADVAHPLGPLLLLPLAKVSEHADGKVDDQVGEDTQPQEDDENDPVLAHRIRLKPAPAVVPNAGASSLRESRLSRSSSTWGRDLR